MGRRGLRGVRGGRGREGGHGATQSDTTIHHQGLPVDEASRGLGGSGRTRCRAKVGKVGVPQGRATVHANLRGSECGGRSAPGGRGGAGWVNDNLNTAHPAAEEDRKTHASAMSALRPMRPRGMELFTMSSMLWEPSAGASLDMPGCKWEALSVRTRAHVCAGVCVQMCACSLMFVCVRVCVYVQFAVSWHQL